MHPVSHGIEFAEPSHNNVLWKVRLLVVIVDKHLATCIEQEDTKESQHPLETFYNGNTGKNENAAQNEGSEDAPKEHFMLILTLDAEEREKH